MLPVQSTSLLPPSLKAPILPAYAFGAAEWKKYIGDVGAEPALPADIEQILSADCPFWQGKKVRDTHLLVLIPQTVNGKPLNLEYLGELVKTPQAPGYQTQYRYFNRGEYYDQDAPLSYWVLMTREVIEGSCNQNYQFQEALLSHKAGGSYAVPNILDANVCIFMEYIRTGTRLYSDSPWSYTRCQEKFNNHFQLVVGGFALGGLGVTLDSGVDYEYLGVGALRKL